MVEASRPIFAGAVSPVSCDDVLLASWAAPQPVDVKVRAAKAPYTERINFHLICELLLQTVRRSIFAQMNGLGFGQGSNSNLWPTECSDELLYRRGETAPHRDAKLGTLIIAPDKKTRLSSKIPRAQIGEQWKGILHGHRQVGDEHDIARIPDADGRRTATRT